MGQLFCKSKDDVVDNHSPFPKPKRKPNRKVKTSSKPKPGSPLSIQSIHSPTLNPASNTNQSNAASLSSSLSLHQTLLSHVGQLLDKSKLSGAQTLRDVYDEVKRELDRLIQWSSDPSTKIALLGNEDASTNSLLNAWMGTDLLPTVSFNTYAITEVHCINGRREKCVLEYFTRPEFADLNSALQATPKTRLHLNGKTREVDIYDVKDILSDRDEALAIKRVSIYIAPSKESPNVTLVHLPLLERNETLVGDARVIIYATRLAPHVRFSQEKQFLSKMSREDKDKTFVALTFGSQNFSADDRKNYKTQERFWEACGVRMLVPCFSKVADKLNVDLLKKETLGSKQENVHIPSIFLSMKTKEKEFQENRKKIYTNIFLFVSFNYKRSPAPFIYLDVSLLFD